jgi:hypothetical protein
MFVFIMSTNRLLLDAASPPRDEEASRLLAKWARLHAVRTCLSLLGFVVYTLAGAAFIDSSICSRPFLSTIARTSSPDMRLEV